MFKTVLVANRGEIACRVMRTCRAMGIGTVAVHSSADRHAPHVMTADRAVRIGASPPASSYLDGGAIIAAARATNADAIHPGYGFLSENPEFAAGCADAGLVFIGPSVEAMRVMASKVEAKHVVRRAGVPVLGDGAGGRQDDAGLAAASRATGFPVMVKPAAGGGGRGMRVVATEAELAPALAAARREAMSSFGDDGLLVERYLEGARHVEVQVFGDGDGRVVHLYERDCSIQRRHQKVVEEAPAPSLSPDVRERLLEAAVAAAGAVDYCGAGTVEFLVAPDGEFWFIEMNTRLQVEHPVTEMVTGTDLVEWQIEVAAGGRLPRAQEDVSCTGHAVEARLCAEDPGDGFRPGVGRLSHLVLPEPGDGLRIDSGVQEGDNITVHYDSMIAKIIAHAPDRDAACERLSDALASVRVAGPATNARFLRAIIDHPGFRNGRHDTGFIDRAIDDLVPPSTECPVPVVAFAALAALSPSWAPSPDRSPWSHRGGWRLGGRVERRIRVLSDDRAHDFRLDADGVLTVGSDTFVTAGEWISSTLFTATLSGVRMTAVVVRDGAGLEVFMEGERYTLAVDDPLQPERAGEGRDNILTAPMPGIVSAVHVAAGDRVEVGTLLMTIEAMKVEHVIRAPADGMVTGIHFGQGARVKEGVRLLEFSAD